MMRMLGALLLMGGMALAGRRWHLRAQRFGFRGHHGSFGLNSQKSRKEPRTMDPAIKKTALRMITYGLFVATSRDDSGPAAGTINWISQSSFTPPLIMVAIKGDSALHRAIANSRRFIVHVVAKDQKDLGGIVSWRAACWSAVFAWSNCSMAGPLEVRESTGMGTRTFMKIIMSRRRPWTNLQRH